MLAQPQTAYQTLAAGIFLTAEWIVSPLLMLELQGSIPRTERFISKNFPQYIFINSPYLTKYAPYSTTRIHVYR